MKLDDVAAVIRPRSGLEAIDLGFVMAVHWRRIVWGAWCTTALPVSLLILLLVPDPGWAVIAIWWLKPLFDRVPLYVLSRALFGATPTLIEVLRNVPRLWSRGLFGALVLYRFSPVRSFTLPVTELEGQRGAEARARARVLKAQSGRRAGHLTFACVLFEGALVMALLVLGYLMLPPEIAPDIELMWVDLMNGEAPAVFDLLYACFTVVAMGVIEPFYVAAGFGLYLNRRTFLEGWDVELTFRRLGERLARAGAHVAQVMVFFWLAGSIVGAVQAQEAAPSGPRDPAIVIAEVLEHEDFSTVTTRLYAPNGSFELDWLWSFLRGLAWVAVATLAAVILWIVLRETGGGALGIGRRRAPPTSPAETAFGLDIRPESLPDDVPGEARRLFAAGAMREALSLLYRASIVHLIERDGLVIGEGDTERDCVAHVEVLADGGRVEYFRGLTQSWQLCAYGRIVPVEARMESLLSGWPSAFGGAA
ncbi:MAG: hypothetical protein GY711_23600 [bacterium]|nr:hypothetical protein [bacterium]